MHHYVYSIHFAEPEAKRNIYFGVRSCRVEPEQDKSYTGSPCTYYEQWSLFEPIKTVIAEYATRKEAEDAETELISKQWSLPGGKECSLNATIRAQAMYNVVGVPKSNLHRQKIRDTLLGRPIAEATKLKMSEVRKGKPKSEQHRKNIGKANSGPCGRSAPNAKACMTPQGKFANAYVAAKAFSLTHMAIRRRCDNVNSKWKDWYWL